MYCIILIFFATLEWKAIVKHNIVVSAGALTQKRVRRNTQWEATIKGTTSGWCKNHWKLPLAEQQGAKQADSK